MSRLIFAVVASVAAVRVLKPLAAYSPTTRFPTPTTFPDGPTHEHHR